MATGIWVRLMHKTRIEKDISIPCARDQWLDALEEACHDLDVPKPLVLPRHERDWEQFSQARFLGEHFMEEIPFDRMEVEFIDPDKKKKNQSVYGK